MRNLTILISILILTISAVGQSGWQTLNSNYTNSLNDVLVVDDTLAFCVGGNTTSGHVLGTSTAGSAWVSQSVSTASLNALAITTSGFWVVGNQGKIYVTVNGTTWTAQTSGTTVDLNDIQFPTATTGYTVGGAGVLRKTVNGMLWTNPIVSGGTTYTLNAVHFTSASNGVIGGDYNFINGFIVQTVSGGGYFGLPITTISKINDIYFTSASIGFAVAQGGNIFKTTNSGSSWSVVSSGTTTNLNAIHFTNASYGYIVGDGGMILKTSDGGASWVQQSSPTTQNLNGVSCLDSNIVYAVGEAGTIIKTTTGGAYLTVSVANDTIYCNGYANLKAQTAYTGFGNLTFTWASSPYLSSTNDSLTTAGPLQQSETFYVTVTDGTMSANDSATVIVSALPPDSICLVTVDDSLGHNVVVFEKHVQGAIDHYNIYAESSVAGVYDSIGFIPADSAGVFVDSASNPAVKAYSYKISTIDSCGNESTLSDFHKTMHLTINVGAGTSWNLIWTHYVGMNVITYRIWRADTSMNWTKIDSVPGTNNSYTDLTPPTTSGLFYQVEIISPYICQPYNYKANTNYNSSRSNTANTIPPAFTANFSANVTAGYLPLTVQFSDLSQGNPTSYLWDFGDGDTSSLASPSHTYTTLGLNTVSLVISNGITTDTMTMVDYIDAGYVGIKGQVNNQIEIYPNPIKQNQSLYIKHSGMKVDQIQIIDLLGKEINFQSISSDNITELKFNDISKGIYFISLMDNEGNRIQKKFIIH